MFDEGGRFPFARAREPLFSSSTLAPPIRVFRRGRRFDGDGIAPCWDNSLHAQYKYHLEMPNGEMENNLVRECDNHDVPDYDFHSCEHNTYMCCWTENDRTGLQDNTVTLVCLLASTQLHTP